MKRILIYLIFTILITTLFAETIIPDEPYSGKDISADFTVSDTLTIIGTEVQFTDLSTGSITNWQWDFDNDSTIDSSLQNPIWAYAEPGIYSVSLSISDETKDTAIEIKTDYIRVTEMDLNADLVAHYPFNGNANDESGNGNDGFLNGASATYDRFGNSDSAFEFDNVDDFIGLPYNSFIDIGDEITISAWVNQDSIETDVIFSSLDVSIGDNFTFGYSLGIQQSNEYGNSNSIFFQMGQSIWQWAKWTSETNSISSGWHHIVVEATSLSTASSDVTFYIDGLESISTPNNQHHFLLEEILL